MSNPLTREQLDRNQCAVAGCDHLQHETLYLHPRCHPGGKTFVAYCAGVLEIQCAVCRKVAITIKVAAS